jgi:hypothetical protein
MSQIRSRAAITSSMNPAPKVPATNAAEPHSRTGPKARRPERCGTPLGERDGWLSPRSA